MAKGDPIPAGDEVTRWIKPRLLGRDDDGNVITDTTGHPVFVFPEAFELRDDEDGLSLTWLQPFGTTRSIHLPAAAEAVRATTDSGRLSGQSAFAVGRVEEIKQAGAAAGVKLRIIEDPIEGNDGHSEIRRYPHEMGVLQSLLAAEVFSERYLYSAVKQQNWVP